MKNRVEAAAARQVAADAAEPLGLRAGPALTWYAEGEADTAAVAATAAAAAVTAGGGAHHGMRLPSSADLVGSHASGR
jgi:hypothetical protein